MDLSFDQIDAIAAPNYHVFVGVFTLGDKNNKNLSKKCHAVCHESLYFLTPTQDYLYNAEMAIIQNSFGDKKHHLCRTVKLLNY